MLVLSIGGEFDCRPSNRIVGVVAKSAVGLDVVNSGRDTTSGRETLRDSNSVRCVLVCDPLAAGFAARVRHTKVVGKKLILTTEAKQIVGRERRVRVSQQT